MIAAMPEEVYKYGHPAGLFTLKVFGRNDGRYAAYCSRIGQAEDSEEAKVEFVEPGGVRRKDKPAFYETRYTVRCDFSADVRDVRVVHKLASVTDLFNFDGRTLVGTLDFINTPGRFRFEMEWTRGEARESAAFEWIVASEKLDVVHDYREIVETIEKKTPGLVRAFLAKSRGTAGLKHGGKTNDEIWADIFSEISELYVKACEWIAGHPHLKYAGTVEHVKAGRVKHWTPGLANRFSGMDGGRRAVADFRTERIESAVDTQENRFVKYTLGAIAERLEKFAGECAKRCGKGAGDTVSQAFVDGLRSKAAQLERLRRKPFFAGVGLFSGFRGTSLALERKQGYCEVYRTWVMLKRTIDMAQTGFNTGHRPISALYEFWCYLKLAEMLEKRYKEPVGGPKDAKDVSALVDGTEEQAGGPAGDSTERTLTKLTWEYDAGGGAKVLLHYQKNYSGDEESEGDFACYNPQIPDIVLTITRGSETYTYLFDAKYRVEERKQNGKMLDASPSEPINDMHRYRDAILYRAMKDGEGDGAKQGKLSRRIIGAYVLYPGRPGESFDYGKLIEHENIGAIPLLPGAKGADALESFLAVILDKPDAAAHLGGDIPTLGTSVVLGDWRWDGARTVLVGYYHHDRQGMLDWIEKNGYNCRVGLDNGALKITDDLLKAEYLLLHGGSNVTDLIYKIDVAAGAKLLDKDDLANLGYENPKHKQYLLFKVKRVAAGDALFGLRCDVSKLPGYAGARNGAKPFTVAMQDVLAVGCSFAPFVPRSAKERPASGRRPRPGVEARGDR